jgi:ADP-ribose pyrophosphatase YjhB (NUDIX family)
MRRFPADPIVAVGAVIVRDDQVVLIRRGQPPLEGEWSLPGGVVELGETLGVALAREVLEETGLVVAVGPVIDVLDRIERNQDGRVEYHYVIVDFLCSVLRGTLVSRSDAAEACWAPAHTLADYRLTTEATRVFRKGLDLASARAVR